MSNGKHKYKRTTNSNQVYKTNKWPYNYFYQMQTKALIHEKNNKCFT